MEDEPRRLSALPCKRKLQRTVLTFHDDVINRSLAALYACHWSATVPRVNDRWELTVVDTRND